MTRISGLATTGVGAAPHRFWPTTPAQSAPAGYDPPTQATRRLSAGAPRPMADAPPDISRQPRRDDASPSPSSSVLSAAASLTTALGQGRRVLQRAVVVEAAVAGVAGVVAAALIAVVIIGAVPFSQVLRVALVALMGTGAVAGIAHVLWHRGRVLRHDVVIAARLEDAMRRRGHDIGDALRGAVELRDSAVDARLGRSRALCDAHIARTVDVVARAQARDSLTAVALERAVPTLLFTAAIAGVLLLSLAAAHDVVLTRLARLWSAEAAAVALAERAAAEPPLVTDITLTLRFPAYMARADEVIPGAAGDVTAPPRHRSHRRGSC